MSPEDRAFVSGYSLAAQDLHARFMRILAGLRAQVDEARKELIACRDEMKRLQALRNSAGPGRAQRMQ